MTFRFPGPLYPIVDADLAAHAPVAMAEALIAAGITFVQLRVKHASTRRLVELAREVQQVVARARGQLIINDRADIAQLVGAAGVHLGQDDLPPAAARTLLGPGKIIGVSTHNLDQIDAALRSNVADYLAFGPVFATQSKERPDPVQGLAGLAAARACCPLPLVAIGGITGDRLGDVLNAGADTVAVIGALASAGDPEATARSLLATAHAATDPRARHRS